MFKHSPLLAPISLPTRVKRMSDIRNNADSGNLNSGSLSTDGFNGISGGAIGASDFEAPSNAQQKVSFKVTPVHLGLFVFALLCLVFIGFISIAKSIQVTAVTPNLSDPDELLLQAADVSINTKLKLPLGNRVLVLPGEHHVKLAASGYQTVEQTLTVSADRHQQFEIVMTRLPGNVTVLLPDNVTAAIAKVDGVDAGDVPSTLKDIAAGVHEISIDADLYRPFSKTITVRGKGETQELTAELQPAWAEYTFDTQPAGANVLIDGVVKGQTPATIKIEEGTRRLVFKAQGFKQYEQELSVVAQETIAVPAIELIPSDGVIELASVPVGAAVILNNEFKGITPISLAVAPNQEQELKVYKAGYQLAQQRFSLSPDEKQAEEFALSPDIINVKLSVSPSDAAVYVNGVRRGSGSQTLALNTLPHSISVRKAGYVTQNNDIVPTRHSEQILSFKLLTEEQHYWAQIPDTYTNGSGHDMKLFRRLGKVTLGSSRREDGRRANEVVYEAELTKPFYVALHETTNKQFRQFQAKHSAGNYKGKSLDANKAPALNVSWQQAAQYCNWLSEREGLDPFYQTVSGFVSGLNPNANGYRLLTEVEWAWLARNTDDGLLTYPWGKSKTAPTGKKIENLADEKAQSLIAFTLKGYQDGYKGPAPVGRFPANHRGLYDMGGNAAEWVNDWYSAKGSSELVKNGVAKDPLGPSNGEFHVVRGASWARGHLPQLRLAYRDYGAKGAHDIGFRVARYAGLSKAKKKRVAKN